MLTIEELPTTLISEINHQELAKNQILFQPGEPTHSIFWLEWGQIKLLRFTQQQIIPYYLVNAGESFAETALYFDAYTCTAITEKPSRVAAIPKQLFLEALNQSPDLSKKYLSHLTHRFSDVKWLLELRSIRSSRERLLHYLSSQLQPGQSTVPLTGSLKSLAIHLGLLPEVLSRTFTQLEAENILTRKKGSATFSDEWLET